MRFHHGRDSWTPKARLSVSVRVEKTLEPAQRAKTAPTATIPGAPFAKMTSLTNPERSRYASSGTRLAQLRHQEIDRGPLVAGEAEQWRGKQEQRKEREEEVVRRLRREAEHVRREDATTDFPQQRPIAIPPTVMRHSKAKPRPRPAARPAYANGRTGRRTVRDRWLHCAEWHAMSDPLPPGGFMAPNTLADLYVDELKDLYSAEQQILKALPKMIKAATHDELKQAFETHREQTEIHVQRLELVLNALGKSPKGKKCHGMQGVLEEGAELIEQDPGSSALDAGLIAKAQHVEHYEMAGYGSVCTWAALLGHREHANVLRQTLEEEKATDALLTDLATETINVNAELTLANESAVADVAPTRSPHSSGGGRKRSRRSRLRR